MTPMHDSNANLGGVRKTGVIDGEAEVVSSIGEGFGTNKNQV